MEAPALPIDWLASSKSPAMQYRQVDCPIRSSNTFVFDDIDVGLSRDICQMLTSFVIGQMSPNRPVNAEWRGAEIERPSCCKLNCEGGELACVLRPVSTGRFRVK